MKSRKHRRLEFAWWARFLSYSQRRFKWVVGYLTRRWGERSLVQSLCLLTTAVGSREYIYEESYFEIFFFFTPRQKEKNPWCNTSASVVELASSLWYKEKCYVSNFSEYCSKLVHWVWFFFVIFLLFQNKKKLHDFY